MGKARRGEHGTLAVACGLMVAVAVAVVAVVAVHSDA
jgi:hypothetical protein